MKRFLYFDLGNVLLNFDHAHAVSQLSKVAGVGEAQVRASIFESGLQDEYECGRVSSDEFVDRFNSATGAAACKRDVLNAVSDMFQPNAAMLPIVSQLRVAGYAMGIISNTCEAHWQFIWQKYDFISALFAQYVLSFEVKSMKPDAPIYQAAAEVAGMPAGDLFFTDDRKENVCGALDAGLDAVQFASPIQLARDMVDRKIRFNY